MSGHASSSDYPRSRYSYGGSTTTATHSASVPAMNESSSPPSSAAYRTTAAGRNFTTPSQRQHPTSGPSGGSGSNGSYHTHSASRGSSSGHHYHDEDSNGESYGRGYSNYYAAAHSPSGPYRDRGSGGGGGGSESSGYYRGSTSHSTSHSSSHNMGSSGYYYRGSSGSGSGSYGRGRGREYRYGYSSYSSHAGYERRGSPGSRPRPYPAQHSSSAAATYGGGRGASPPPSASSYAHHPHSSYQHGEPSPSGSSAPSSSNYHHHHQQQHQHQQHHYYHQQQQQHSSQSSSYVATASAGPLPTGPSYKSRTSTSSDYYGYAQPHSPARHPSGSLGPGAAAQSQLLPPPPPPRSSPPPPPPPSLPPPQQHPSTPPISMGNVAGPSGASLATVSASAVANTVIAMAAPSNTATGLPLGPAAMMRGSEYNKPKNYGAEGAPATTITAIEVLPWVVDAEREMARHRAESERLRGEEHTILEHLRKSTFELSMANWEVEKMQQQLDLVNHQLEQSEDPTLATLLTSS